MWWYHYWFLISWNIFKWWWEFRSMTHRHRTKKIFKCINNNDNDNNKKTTRNSHEKWPHWSKTIGKINGSIFLYEDKCPSQHRWELIYVSLIRTHAKPSQVRWLLLSETCNWQWLKANYSCILNSVVYSSRFLFFFCLNSTSIHYFRWLLESIMRVHSYCLMCNDV